MPIVSSAGNAAAARARAMYGKRLTNQQYHELCTMHSVAEIVSYLKRQSAYTAVLAEVKDTAVHRSALEQMLRMKAAGNLQKLFGYDNQIDRLVSMYHQQQVEIRWILRWLRAKTEAEDETWFLSLTFGATHSKLDPVRMHACKTMRALAEELKDTVYYTTLCRFADRDQLPTVTALETALLCAQHAHLQKTIEATDSDGITALLGCRNDVQNIERIWRLKKYFHASPEDIRAQLLPYGGNVTPAVMQKMIDAVDADEVTCIFLQTPFCKTVQTPENEDFEMLLERLPFLKARYCLHFSADALVVCMAYAILEETELHNLIHIVEGVRYGMEPSAILDVLILEH